MFEPYHDKGRLKLSKSGVEVLNIIDRTFLKTLGWAEVVFAVVLAFGMFSVPEISQAQEGKLTAAERVENHIDANDRRITQMEEKIASLEDDRRKLADPTLLEHRITVLESELDTVLTLLKSLLASVLLLVLESVHRLLIKKRPEVTNG